MTSSKTVKPQTRKINQTEISTFILPSNDALHSNLEVFLSATLQTQELNLQLAQTFFFVSVEMPPFKLPYCSHHTRPVIYPEAHLQYLLE